MLVKRIRERLSVYIRVCFASGWHLILSECEYCSNDVITRAIARWHAEQLRQPLTRILTKDQVVGGTNSPQTSGSSSGKLANFLNLVARFFTHVHNSMRIGRIQLS